MLFFCVSFSGLLLQENERFTEALHYYKLAIGSRPTLACKSTLKSLLFMAASWWLEQLDVLLWADSWYGLIKCELRGHYWITIMVRLWCWIRSSFATWSFKGSYSGDLSVTVKWWDSISHLGAHLWDEGQFFTAPRTILWGRTGFQTPFLILDKLSSIHPQFNLLLV